MKILSWNTLHIMYEKKYNPDSKILITYKNETHRLTDIVKTIKNNLSDSGDEETIICLQECSLDLVYLLKLNFCKTHDIFTLNINDDEYLITLTPHHMHFTDENFPITEYINMANGYLFVSNDNYRIINCHMFPQYYCQNYDALSVLKNLSHVKKLIIAGDFNEKYQRVSKALNNDYIVPYYGKTYKKKRNIDYIIFNKFNTSLQNNYLQNYYKVRLVETEKMSDHDLIILDINV
jgi:hypothetical protein